MFYVEIISNLKKGASYAVTFLESLHPASSIFLYDFLKYMFMYFSPESYRHSSKHKIN